MRLQLIWAASTALLVLSSCSKNTAGGGGAADDASTPVTPVQVETAKRETMHSVITTEGVLYPLKQANVMPKITAPVARFLVQRGDHVREGQLVAVLEDRDLAAATQESKQLYEQASATAANTQAATMPNDLTKARTDAASAQQTLEAAQKVYDNRVALFHEGAIAQKLVDDAKVALVQAQSLNVQAQQTLKTLGGVGQTEQLRALEAQTAAAKAHYESSAAQQSYAEVRSPMTGVISDRPLNIGEVASTGQAIVSVVDLSRVTARANVSVQQAASVMAGKAATISSGTVTLKGKVTVVSPAVDPNTTTVQIWVQAANPGEKLKLGSTVQISIDAGAIPNAIAIPAAALLASDEGGEKVMLAGKDGLAHEQPVKVGVRSGDDVQILSGVNEGDAVIVQGALGLDDKAKVKPTAAGSDAAEGKDSKDEDDKK